MRPGELIALIGANGAGKTTTLKTISGLVKARRGEVGFRGADIAGLAPNKIVRQGLSHVPEGRQIFAKMTVWANLELGGYLLRDREDVVQVAFNYGLFTGAFGLHYGAEQIGASVVPSSVGNTRRQVRILKDYRTTTLVCTPSYALRIAEVIKQMGVDPKILALKQGLFGGEPWGEEVRQAIEERLYIKAYDNYGLSEVMGPGVAGECPNRAGMHVAEDHFITEIIDPDTGEVLQNGTTGELVLTTVTKEAFPVIRFRTGDLASLDDSPCPCGRTLARISRISGRCDDIIIVKGVNIYPGAVGPILEAVTGVAPVYQLVVGLENDQDFLGIRIEVSEAMFFDKMERQRAMVDRLRKKVRDTLGITPRIWLVEAGSIRQDEETAPMVVDRRGGPEAS